MKLDELRKLAEAATPGPWDVFFETPERMAIWLDDPLNGPINPNRPPKPLKRRPFAWGDREFIAAARTALPLLLDVAEAAHTLARGYVRLAQSSDDWRTLIDALAALEAAP